MIYQGKTQRNVKIDNQKIILRLLHDFGPMSRADLAKSLNSSKPTISKNVEDLLKAHQLVEVGKADNMVGKKAMLVDVNGNYGYVMALDLSKNQIKIVISDLKGKWLFFEEAAFHEGLNVLEFIQEFLIRHSTLKKKILQVVIAYPGVVGHNDAYYLTNYKLKEKILKEAIAYLKHDLNGKISVKNDVNLAIIAEKHDGIHAEEANLYYISGDVGVGSGIILNHRLFEGDRNAAGEIAFVMPHEKVDGQYDTLEARISVNALTLRYEALTGSAITFEDFNVKVNQGEETAITIYEDVLNDLSVAITNVASILDIQHVIVSGRLFDIKADTIEILNQKVGKMTPFETKIEKSKVQQSTLKGAVYVGIDAMIQNMVSQA
jgi:predicted NBD/HSP70 family sugar kinase